MLVAAKVWSLLSAAAVEAAAGGMVELGGATPEEVTEAAIFFCKSLTVKAKVAGSPMLWRLPPFTFSGTASSLGTVSVDNGVLSGICSEDLRHNFHWRLLDLMQTEHSHLSADCKKFITIMRFFVGELMVENYICGTITGAVSGRFYRR